MECLRAVTGYSESVILSDMVGTSRHTATIRPTEQEHPTRTPERAGTPNKDTRKSLAVSEQGRHTAVSFPIRQRTPDSTPYFVGKDVAEILGYVNPTKAIREKVDDEDKLMSKMDTSFGSKDTYIINESGLYSLILSSKLPKAKELKRLYLREYQREQAAQK